MFRVAEVVEKQHAQSRFFQFTLVIGVELIAVHDDPIRILLFRDLRQFPCVRFAAGRGGQPLQFYPGNFYSFHKGCRQLAWPLLSPRRCRLAATARPARGSA